MKRLHSLACCGHDGTTQGQDGIRIEPTRTGIHQVTYPTAMKRGSISPSFASCFQAEARMSHAPDLQSQATLEMPADFVALADSMRLQLCLT